MIYQPIMHGSHATATFHEKAQRMEHEYKKIFSSANISYEDLLEIWRKYFPEDGSEPCPDNVAKQHSGLIANLADIGWTPPEYD